MVWSIATYTINVSDSRLVLCAVMTIATQMRFALSAIALAICCVLSSCGIGGGFEIGGLKPGEKAPTIEPQTWINGPPPSQEGKVVVVDAWSVRCGPCVAALPKMYKLHQKFGPKGVVFIGIVSEQSDRIEDVTKTLKQYQIEYPNAFGASQSFIDFQVRAIPQVWVIGRDGIIAWNRDSGGTIEAAIEKALGAGEATGKTGSVKSKDR